MTNAFRTPPSVLRLAGAAVLAVAALTSTTASASAGRTQGVYAGDRFTVIRWTQPAFTSITVETGDLAPLAAGATPDTVLHVFNAAAPSQFFAGNDDAAGLTSPYASSVGVGMPPFGAPRQLIIVVRAYSSARAGTGNLRIKTGSAVLATFPMLFEAGTSVDMGTYAAGMHALAVEEQGGQGDPLMLLQAGTADHATAFDDDAALGLTPFIHADDPCSSACKAIVGTAWTGGTGTLFGGSKTTTVFWDPDMHVAGQDIDADGLSTALENAIGTDATNDDTDQDGLKDGLEVLGGKLRQVLIGVKSGIRILARIRRKRTCLSRQIGKIVHGIPARHRNVAADSTRTIRTKFRRAIGSVCRRTMRRGSWPTSRRLASRSTWILVLAREQFCTRWFRSIMGVGEGPKGGPTGLMTNASFARGHGLVRFTFFA